MRASHWSEKSAEDFCLSVRDGTHDSPKPTPYGKKLITSKNIIGGNINLENAYKISIEDAEKVDKRSLVEQWDVLISMIGTVGEVCLIKEKPDFSIKNIGLFKSKGKAEGIYLYYYLKSKLAKNYIENRLAGSTQKYISLTELRSMPIKYPENREEMYAINSTLSYLDDKIDLNRRTNETLEAMARALFRDWFVDFGPTRAKMAGEAPYLAPELWELFPGRLDNEGKPEGWRIASIDSLCRITSGKRPPNKETSPSDENPVPVYGGNGISWFTKDVLFNQPFLITGRVGTLGTVFRINEKCWVSDNALCLFPKIDSYFEYLYFIVSGIDFQSLNSGSTQPLLTQSSLLSQECILPAEEIITIFHTQISVWFEMQQQLEKESHTLAQLRDLLLPKLMSGEISIRDAEKMVEDAA